MKYMYLFVATCFALVSISAISDDNDSKRVRRLVQEKKIISLESLMPSIRKQGDFKVLEIELDEDDGKLVYEVELLDKEGRVYEIKYDARTGQELDLELSDN